MKLNSDCDYFHDERDNEFAPPNGECEFCYRYEIYKKSDDILKEEM